MTSTNKLIADTNESVPRIIYRGKTTITNDTATSNSQYYGTASVTIASIKANPPHVVRSYLYDSGNRELKRLPVYDNASVDMTTPAFIESTYHSLDSDGGSLRITFTRYSVIPETFTIYYNVYSTEITSGDIL